MRNVVKLGLHESKTIQYFCNDGLALIILENVSLVLVLSKISLASFSKNEFFEQVLVKYLYVYFLLV